MNININEEIGEDALNGLIQLTKKGIIEELEEMGIFE